MHHHVHRHTHEHAHDIDWDALCSHPEREAELHTPALTQATNWLRDLLGGAGVRRVLDVDSGPGVVASLLADAFPDAEVVAVDQSPALLERARTRSSCRIATQ
ncbi:class I SAM-dependent methyltransferase [Streptomyces sp. NPDC002346]